MEYTVKELAELSGITSRTVRYYDEIDLLKPARINPSGYRIYGPDEVTRLQQILFYRELDVGLDSIKKILNSPSFDEVTALKEHREKLFEKKEQLELLIVNLDRTIMSKERGIIMNDQERFEGFKKRLVDDNEKKYGKEIREKYGDEVVENSNKKVKNMTQEEYAEVTEIEKKLMVTLHSAIKTGDPAGELAQKAADLHRQWISYYWDSYNEEAHAGVAQMYTADERFKAYYDKEQPGTAEFLRDAILIYTSRKNQ
ncbi:MAG: MerR family transcriptional regulator [Halanaerobium sp.]|nr:MerR family transcriptional regulator [Halanaerobium sp.]